jgi:gliding motility-associated-like protein
VGNTVHSFFRFLRIGFVALTALLFCLHATLSVAQITVHDNKTATQLATSLIGTGVTLVSSSLNCAGAANGIYTTSAIDPIGIPTGIVLSSGCVIDTLGSLGIAHPATSFSSHDFASGGDADLATLTSVTLHDACVLVVSFKPAGDTVRFNYVFGSEEYPDYACSDYNDVFGFFITGGAFVTPTNLALIPGTTIPVCINSINCGPGSGYSLSTCTALGGGSPYCAYYIDNSTDTLLSVGGLTHVFAAVAAVSPCDTYTIKMGVADAGDGIFDSDVFIQGGSLTSTPTTSVTSTGTSGLPYCIRGCAPGNFVFHMPTPQDTAYTIYYTVSGTAVSGFDYVSVGTSVVVPPLADSVIVNVNTLGVPPTGPKVISLQLQIPNPCHPGLFTPGPISTLTILDSFHSRIITPDTLVCIGQSVHIIAQGDTSAAFAGILNYTWAPAATLSTSTGLSPTATALGTTTYSLTVTAPSVLGCSPEINTVTISVYAPLSLTVDSPIVKTCDSIPVQLHVFPDTVGYTYKWTPATYLSDTSIYNPIVDPTVPGDYTYTVTVFPNAAPACSSTDTVHVHNLPHFFDLGNIDTTICTGVSIITRVSGDNEFSWMWSPTTGVSNPAIMNPVVTPTVSTTYVVTASYAHCPDMVEQFHVTVDLPVATTTFIDTLCLGNTDTFNLTVPGPGTFHYGWTPATYLLNDTAAVQLITPGTYGDFSWTVTIQPLGISSCAIVELINMHVVPNKIPISPVDTSICLGQAVQIRAGFYVDFTYQWLPTAGIGMSTIINPLITPDTSATYVLAATYYKCPVIYDTVNIDVEQNPQIFAGFNRFVCQPDTLHLTASVTPQWYNYYSYSWSPGASLWDSTSQTVVFDDSISRELVLTVTTPAGCAAKDSLWITVYPGNFLAPMPDLSFCPGDSAMLHPAASVPDVTYRWVPPIYLSDSTSATPILKPLTSQGYMLIGTSGHGCKDSVTFHAAVSPAAIIFLGDSTTIYPGETYQINPQTNCVNFLWSPAYQLSDATASNPIATPDMNIMYTVVASTVFGCKATDSISIYVSNESLVDVPNAFTPGTGINNQFKIIKRGIVNLNYFRVFNRWGNLIFETTDINQGWDGSYKGKPQDFGVYVYELQCVTNTGKIYNKQGNVTLIR